MTSRPELAGPADPPVRGVPRRRRRRRWAVRGVVVLLLLGLALVGGVVALWPLTPSVSDAAQRVNSLLAAQHTVGLTTLPVPNKVGDAVIATENSRFSNDFGIDPISLLRTGVGSITGGRDRGAATLEVQLAKNLYTPGSTEMVAKLEQVEVAFKLDQRYPKDTILLMYLNAAYFGHGYYGLGSAARGYFGTGPDNLSWAQASLLAGLVQAPSVYDPYVHLALAKSRQRHVLDRLVASHVLNSAEADAAYQAPLSLQ